MELANGCYETGVEVTESVDDDDYHGDGKGRRTRRNRQVLVASQADLIGWAEAPTTAPNL